MISKTLASCGLKKMLMLGCALIAFGVSRPVWAESVKPHRAEDIRDSIGVNTHFNYMDGAYANVPFVLDALAYLGVSHVRDLTPTPWIGGSAPMSHYERAMDAGINFTFMDHLGSRDPTVMMGNLKTLNERIPGHIAAIEGFNEVDHNALNDYKGLSGLPAAKLYQRDMYRLVKADDKLGKLPILDFTGGEVGEPGAPNDVPGRADMINFHIYAQNGNQPSVWINEAAEATKFYKLPAVITEFGYASMPQSGWLVIGVDEVAQAKGTLNGLFDSLNLGFERLFLYELVDQKPDPKGKNLEQHFGLFDNKFRRKAIAKSLHKLTGLIRDTSGTSRTFETNVLDYDLKGLPASAHSMVFEKSNGVTYLAIWNEVPMWDRATGKPIAATPTYVSLKLKNGSHAVAVHNLIQISTSAVTTSHKSDLVIPLAGDPLLIEIAR
jgi:hypothetical protein